MFACETIQRVRDPDIEHLALAHQVVQRPHQLLDRRDGVPGVDPEQVQVAGLQPLGLIDRLDQVLALVAARVRVVADGRHRRLRRHHQPLAVRPDQLTQELLARPEGVVVGGVHEVARPPGTSRT